MTGFSTQGGFGAPPQPTPQPQSQEEISGSPLWHLFDYDLTNQTIALMRIEERIYRETSFLDQRIGSYNCPMVLYEMRHMAQMFPGLGQSRGPLGFIFHIGHCGSTLLSRALSTSEAILPFREPMSLRTLSADQHELEGPMSFLTVEQWESLMSTILDSLSRRFPGGRINIVKATSTSNNLISPILTRNDQQRAVLLYLPLENYLATMLGKPREGSDLWGQARKRMQDWIRIESAPRLNLYDMQAPQFATLSWLTSMNHMLAARDAFGDRVRMINFETLIARPEEHLVEVASFFGVEDQADQIVNDFSQVSSGYSKQPNTRYTAETRKQILQQTREQHADGISTGLSLARSLITQAPSLERCTPFVD